MKNMDFQQAAQKTEGRAGGLHKKAVCRKGQPSGPPFFTAQLTVQPAVMYSPLARPVVQLAVPPFCAACQPTENSCFSFGKTACQPSVWCYL